jgi:hypothetical protein
MNRALMNRQMFKMGGAAFPDLSGDGQVTQKDILMGRGVIEKQEGGMVPQAPMMMEETMVAAPEPAMMPQEGQASPEGFTQIFEQLQGQVDTLDESDDLEEMMNAVRGDVQPVEARRAELAEYVGPDDAQQTPDTVLALVQPVMQLASIDQGIGSLAAEEMMDTPVEGPMAEGIMSTVNMAPEMAPDMAAPPTMMEVGSPPPVNFNQGGAVQYFAPQNPRVAGFPNVPVGGAVEQEALDFDTQVQDRLDTFNRIIGQRPDQAANLARQEELAKSQMLFDIANTALAFATPGERAMSPAERLAEAAQETQLFDKIGARSQGILEAQKADELAAYEDRQAKGLAAIASAEGALERASLQQFQAGEAGLDRSQQLLLQGNEFNFDTATREDIQDYENDVRRQVQRNTIELMGLEDKFDKSSIRLRDKLQKQQMALTQQYTIFNNRVAFDNLLKERGVMQAYDIEKMELGQEQNLARMKFAGEIEKEAQLLNQAFTASENALKRLQEKDLQFSDQAFRAELQDDAQLFNMTEADKDRAIAKVNRAFDEKLALRTADQKDRGLTIQEAQVAVDDMYKSGMLIIEEAGLQSNRLGSESKTKQIGYLSDPERLNAYAAGELGDKTVEFEQAVLDYTKPEKVWDSELGRFKEGAAGQLSPTILESIGKGNPKLYQQITRREFEADSADADADKILPSGRRRVSLRNATTEIFNDDGKVNTNSPLFEGEGNHFDPEVNYREVIGASRVPGGVGATLSEGYAELSGGKSSEEAQNYARAQQSLKNLANDLLLFNTNQSDDRVLKFVQELFEEEVNELRPGGLIFKTDAKAYATLQGMSDTLTGAMRKGSEILPEYGGTPSGYSEKQVTQVRKDMIDLKYLLADVLAFKESFDYTPEPKTGSREEKDQSLSTARQQISGYRKGN